MAASPADVWAVMCDIERWPEWTESISSVVLTSAGALGVGSTARVEQPKLPAADFVVTTWQPGRGFDWVTKSAGVTAVGHHGIEPIAAGSRVTLWVEFSGPLSGVIAWLYSGLTTRYVRTEAEGLKRRVESAAAGRAPVR